MIKAQIPTDESARLAQLYRYQVLDTAPEPKFDELTELVATVLDVPIALVSLVDEHRQWFKSRHGLDATEAPRDTAFCGHAILDDSLLIVEDSHSDERFNDNPLVTDEPNVRFYAGMPLITKEGYKIGTVCGIDHIPRTLSKHQMRILEIVSRQVIDQLELRRNCQIKDELFQQQTVTLQQLETANQEIRDFVSVVAHDLRAPILNAVGFSEELVASADELNELVVRSGDLVCDSIRKQISELLDDDIRDAAVHISRSALQMNERVSAVATMSRFGHRDIQLETIDLNDLVDQVRSDHEFKLQQFGGEIDVDVLPHVNADKISLQLIIENIVANAVKYRHKNRPLRLRIWADKEDDGLLIHFKDNGRGIDDDDLDRIFVMFRRVGQQDTEGDGTGLAYSRNIINRLGGRIWCESIPKQGSIFHVHLPYSVSLQPIAEPELPAVKLTTDSDIKTKQNSHATS